MPRGDKGKYTDKQKRRAEHIADGYSEGGVGAKEAKRRAWATVNAESHGGEKPGGSGYGKPETHQASRKGGRIGARRRTAASRASGGRKAAATRKRHAAALHRKRSVAAKRAAAKRSGARRGSAKRASGRRRS